MKSKLYLKINCECSSLYKTPAIKESVNAIKKLDNINKLSNRLDAILDICDVDL
jgi:hypothetical protein